MSHDNCEYPERKPKEGKCSEEQMRKCHGNEEDHPCERKK